MLHDSSGSLGASPLLSSSLPSAKISGRRFAAHQPAPGPFLACWHSARLGHLVSTGQDCGGDLEPPPRPLGSPDVPFGSVTKTAPLMEKCPCFGYQERDFWTRFHRGEDNFRPTHILPGAQLTPFAARGEALAHVASPGWPVPSSGKHIYRRAKHNLLFSTCDFRLYCRLKDLSFSFIQQVGLWWLFQYCSSHGLWDVCAEALCKLNYSVVIAWY